MFTKSAAFYDAVYNFKDYSREVDLLRGIFQRAGIKPGASVLDVACGTGKHLELLRGDYQVEGLDIDGNLLAHARERLPDVPLYQADMTSFDLSKQFDAVTCLFSSIGYVGTVSRLNATVAAMAKHLKPGGVLIVEPWLTPEKFENGHLSSLFVDEPELKIARMARTERAGDLSSFEFHYLLGTPDGVEHFTEQHVLTLFTDEQYRAAFAEAGLSVDYDPSGLMGRGLYTGVKA